MKRQETLDLEEALHNDTLEKRIYGCEEITIGFYNSGHGNEIVDFMTMDSKGIIKCYELKVTLQDLKSNAKKSWYGHYNYLVTTPELYAKIDNWDDYIPRDVGIVIGGRDRYRGKMCLSTKRKPKKQNISKEQEMMLKESMVRSLYWKMKKYQDTQSIEIHKKLKQEVANANKEKNRYYERALKAEQIINDYENYTFCLTGKDIDLQKKSKELKEKYLQQRRENRERRKTDLPFFE